MERTNTQSRSATFHLLGTVQFARFMTLQQSLLSEASVRGRPKLDVMLCEHPPIITVGRAGSRRHIRMNARELRQRKLAVRWVRRGGGCLFHGPGQLCVYPVVPLDAFRWSAGDYMRQLNAGLLNAMSRLGFNVFSANGRFGVWGRTGQLGACGVAVRYGVAHFGAYINVHPSMELVRSIDVADAALDLDQKTTMSSLVAEHGRPVKMTIVRSVIIEQLAAAFGCPSYHMNTGHPMIPSLSQNVHSSNSRIS